MTVLEYIEHIQQEGIICRENIEIEDNNKGLIEYDIL